MSAVNDLVAAAQRQLDEHKVWLTAELEKLTIQIQEPGSGLTWEAKWGLVSHVEQIRLRVASAAGGRVQVVYEYPDELYAFLSSDAAPAHLRAALAGGHAVDPDKPISTVKRAP